jgi:hypothetical protein
MVGSDTAVRHPHVGQLVLEDSWCSGFVIMVHKNGRRFRHQNCRAGAFNENLCEPTDRSWFLKLGKSKKQNCRRARHLAGPFIIIGAQDGGRFGP